MLPMAFTFCAQLFLLRAIVSVGHQAATGLGMCESDTGSKVDKLVRHSLSSIIASSGN